LKKSQLLLIVVLVAISVFLDQASKWGVQRFMSLSSSSSIIGEVVRFTYTRNPNAVFGISLSPTMRLVFTLLSLLVIVGVIIYFKRLADGKTDFIDIGLGNTRWPVFNIADSAVTVGAIILILSMYLDGRKSNKEFQSTQGKITS